MLMVGGDRIRTLRAVSPRGDALALRRHLEQALGTAELHPRGLPARAIVCVRRMRLPPPARRADVWVARVERRMQELLPGGVRPFREAIPANAEVVVFLDEAELLACLARDWLRGEGHAWWWRGLLGHSADAMVVQRAFDGAPAFVPAAFELLADRGMAVDVMRRLPASYCERLGAAIALTFGVSGWSNHAAPPATAPPDAAGRVHAVWAATPAFVTKLEAVLDDLAAAERGVALSSTQRALLAVALVLRRAPALARAVGFVAALRERVSSAPCEAPSQGTVIVRSERSVAPSATTATAAPITRDDHAASASPEHDTVIRQSGRDGVDVSHVPPPVDRVAIDAMAPPDVFEAFVPVAPASPSAAGVHRVGHGRVRASADDAVVVSAFAGLVYLVNLALYLEIYGDFTQPARPGLALPLGDFLALVGERACGPSLRTDAIWGVLAALAGREDGESPGHTFAAHDELAHWLDDMERWLEARAALALGMADGAALPFLCARAGRVALSATRLDAIFPLAEHPLEIRLAGLDRNPGWVPAAGRVIELHYE